MDISSLLRLRRSRLVLLLAAGLLGVIAIGLSLLGLAQNEVWGLALVVATSALAIISLLALRLAVKGTVDAESSKSRIDRLSRDIAKSIENVNTEVAALKQQISDQQTASTQRERKVQALQSSSAEHARETEQLNLRAQRLEQGVEQLEQTSQSIVKSREKDNERRQKLAERLTQTRDESKRLFDAARESRKKLSERLGRLEKQTRSDRADWALNFARRDTNAEIPERVLVIVSIHRSGSTRLFDIIRAHPDVYVEPLAFLWNELGLDGRRYPQGLSDAQGAAQLLEVQKGVGAAMPVVDAVNRSGLGRASGRTAVEKIHPQFYGFDATSFANRLDNAEVRLGTHVDLVYLIRSPLDAMWSMAEYKQREPRWYADLAEPDIPRFIQRSLVSLKDLMEQRPGPLIDFSEIRRDADRMVDIGRAIGSSNEGSTIEEWLNRAFPATAVGNLSETNFVGERDPDRSPEGPDSAWSGATEEVEAANDIYDKLRNSQAR